MNSDFAEANIFSESVCAKIEMVVHDRRMTNVF